MIQKGPFLPQSSSHQLCYRQSSFSAVQSQSEISVQIRQADECKSNRLINRKQNFFENSGSRNVSQRFVENEKPSQKFIKLLFKNRMIERFKRNLLQRAYVVPNQMREKILKEPCLINKNQKQNRQRISKFVLQPTSLTYWDPICIFETIISLWLSPFLSSFQNVDQSDFDGIMIMLMILIIVDILINFNRAIIIQGEVISERYFIMIHYLRNSALEDCISMILWIVIFINGINNEIIPIIQVIISIKRLIRKFEEYMESHYLKGQMGNILDLIILMTSIYFFAHITACIWHYIGIKTMESGCWLTYYEIQDQSSWVKYNFSFYFATMTMITVGYGDITPKNQYEMVFTNGIMLISSCIFGYAMSAIGNILKSINDNKSKFKRSMILINSFMSKNQVDQSLQSRIRSYLKYLSESENSDNIEDINSIVNELPKGLQSELHSDVSLRIVNNMHIITKNFTKPTQEVLTQIMVPLKCTPSEIICKQGGNDSDLYYIEQGQVQIFELLSNKILETLSTGQTFGEYQFFTGFPSKISAMSVGFCKLQKINRSCFMENIQFIQKDFERFHSIKDQLAFNQNCCVLLKNCSICKKYSHFVEDCPQLLYKPDLERLLLLQQIRPQKNRQKHYRNERRINSIGMLHQIQQSVQTYQVYNNQSTSLLENIQNQQESNITNEDQPPSYHTPTIQICRTNKSQLSKIVHIPDLRRRSSQQITQHTESALNVLLSPEKCMLDEFQPHIQSNDLQFDLLRNYTFYMPHNNLLDNLKLKEIYQKIHRIINLKKFKELAQYTLSYALKLKILRFKQQIQNLIDLDI